MTALTLVGMLLAAVVFVALAGLVADRLRLGQVRPVPVRARRGRRR